MKTTVYICADSTLTYGPYGGREKIIKAALPIATTENEAEAMILIQTVGRMAYDTPESDARFEKALNGREIQQGYGPKRRFYYSFPEFEIDNVETVFAVRAKVAEILASLRRK